MTVKFSRSILFGIFVVAAFLTHAQTVAGNVKELTIGDKCPDFVFKNIINSKSKITKLSDYKGKLVILDFWATWCSPCIASLPVLDSFQREFNKSIVVLPVTYEDAKKVSDFVRLNKRLNQLKLPFLTNDNFLSKVFKHNQIPHEVWINGEGVVVAITSSLEVTRENIRKMLEAKTKVNLKTKKDLEGGDPTKPIIAGGLSDNFKLDSGLIKYSSILLGRIDGAPARIETVVTKDYSKRMIGNWPILQLYRVCLKLDPAAKSIKRQGEGDLTDMLYSRIILELKDSSMIGMRLGKKNGKLEMIIDPNHPVFCYDQYIPLRDSSKGLDYMAQDLNRYFGSMFGIEGLIEKRKVKCWVLKQTHVVDSLRSKGGTAKSTIGPNREYYTVTNFSFKKWLTLFFRVSTLEYSPIPIVNEVNVNYPINIDIRCDLTDFDQVKSAVKKYGLAFELEERELDMMIIRDNPKK